jgi:MaoC like domain
MARIGPDISNPIHSTAVAREYGFRAPLVGGVTVLGWCVPAILQALGERWLEDGWVDVRFRRPVFPGDVMTATVEDGVLLMSNGAGEQCLAGAVACGRAPWAGELSACASREALPTLPVLPELTLESAPTDSDLRAMALPYFEAEALAYAGSLQRDAGPPWLGPDARIHPGWIAARMTPLLKHSYRYGPSIHTRSQVQNLAPAMVGQVVTVAGHFVRAYEEKGHHHAVLDGVLLSESGQELSRLRHTTIFRPAKRV